MEKLLIKEYYYGRQNRHYIEDDLVDRLNSKVTILLLMSAILIITGSMYVGKPINCWAPGNVALQTRIWSIDLFLRHGYLAEFKGPHDNYMNSVCWLKGSYYLPTDESMLITSTDFPPLQPSRSERSNWDALLSGSLLKVDLELHHRIILFLRLVTIPDRSKPRTYYVWVTRRIVLVQWG